MRSKCRQRVKSYCNFALIVTRECLSMSDFSDRCGTFRLRHSLHPNLHLGRYCKTCIELVCNLVLVGHEKAAGSVWCKVLIVLE